MIEVVCDLDGVVYRGNTTVPGADAALRLLEDAGARIAFVTNNSSRSPHYVAEKISRLTSFDARADMVCTSAQAGATMLRPDDSPVLVVGGDGIVSALGAAGVPTTPDPGEARSIMVGLDREMTYAELAGAADAVRAGARFIATNVDPTFPVEGGRLLPGAGALVAAISTASGVTPEIAGKPHRPMRDLVKSRGLTSPWVIGDRVDTDIAMAAEEPGWRSILVLTGVTGERSPMADAVAPDLLHAVNLVLAAAPRR